MTDAKRSLDVLEVRSPCTEDWDLMTGGGNVRHCGVCDKNVYDLSGLSREDAEALVSRAEGAPCVRFYKRADGTVLTADCAPERHARQQAVGRRALAWGAVMVGGLLSLTAGLGMAALFGYHELADDLHVGDQPCDYPMMGEAMPIEDLPQPDVDPATEAQHTPEDAAVPG